GFARRTAEAARGNEQFLQGFRLLGFTQREVAEGMRDLDRFLITVSDRIAALPHTAQQSAVAMILMSDAGRQMVPMLARGGAAIEEMMQRARDAGIVTREEYIAVLSMVSAETAMVQARTAGLAREFAAGFAPAVMVVIDRV